MYKSQQFYKRAFTLIELSIVLVIIGLLAGGVLFGRDLIKAAEIRAQISQIERYNTAVHTFRLKYNALPGDMKASEVAAAGFAVLPNRVGTQAQGDGNGLLEGIWSGGISRYLQHGETVWFWVDLSANSGLIYGDFRSATSTPTISDSGWSSISNPNISRILPVAKIGNGNFISVYSENVGVHYYIISKIDNIDGNGAPYSTVSLSLSPQQAYAIDSKMDDGLPQTGRIKPRYVLWTPGHYNLTWAAGGGAEGATGTAATPASDTTCYDNGNVGGATQQYSMATNGGNGLNCALSFRFQ